MVKDLLRVCLRWFGSVTAALALGLSLPQTAVLAQNQPSIPNSLTAQEEDIREAAFLFLFEIGTGPDPDYSFYCLSVNSSGLTSGDDPSEALLKRFPRMHRTVRKASECEIVKKPKDLFSAVRDKQSGKPAWMVSLTSINFLNDKEIRVGGTRYCGGLCLWSSTLQATLEDGKWKVRIAPGAPVLVSRGFSCGEWVQACVSREVRKSVKLLPVLQVTDYPVYQDLRIKQETTRKNNSASGGGTATFARAYWFGLEHNPIRNHCRNILADEGQGCRCGTG